MMLIYILFHNKLYWIYHLSGTYLSKKHSWIRFSDRLTDITYKTSREAIQKIKGLHKNVKLRHNNLINLVPINIRNLDIRYIVEVKN